MAGNDRLKILQVCSAREAIYGAVQSLMTLARAQRSAGDDVSFLTFKGKRFGSQVRNEGFLVHEVSVRAKIDPIAILQFRKLIKNGGIDIVHTHLSTSSVNGCLAAKLARVPSVATVHGMSGKGSFMAATHMIAVSEGIKRHLVAQGVQDSRVSVVYNGFDLQPDLAKRAVVKGRFPVLGTVSRVTALKGIDDAIRATAIVKAVFPDASFVVVGDGDAVESCRSLAMELGLSDSVQFLGYRNDIEALLAGMDIFVFPSLKEGMGIALVEAMALGRPCVATNVGGIPEVLTSECGLLVPPKTPDALAAAILEILQDDSRRLEMGEAGRKRAASVFSVESMRARTDKVYRKLLSTT